MTTQTVSHLMGMRVRLGSEVEELKGDASWRERYDAYLLSSLWRARRFMVLIRDGGRCRGCGGRATQVHHINYKRLFREHPSDLLSLCRGCHEAKHPELQKYSGWL